MVLWTQGRGVRYKRYRKYTGVNLRYGMDFDDTVRPVWMLDLFVCKALQSKWCINTVQFYMKLLFHVSKSKVTRYYWKYDNET